MGHRTKTWFGRIGMIGHLARMVVFLLVGSFLIKAAVDYKPHDAVGMDGALAKLADRAYGPLALGVVAAGLVAFALYSLSDARYHRIGRHEAAPAPPVTKSVPSMSNRIAMRSLAMADLLELRILLCVERRHPWAHEYTT
jgi:hypothetical protein